MTRSESIVNLISRIRAIGLTDGQVRVIYGLLVQRRTHRELAEDEGLSVYAARQRIVRARNKAKLLGVKIPMPRATGGRAFWKCIRVNR